MMGLMNLLGLMKWFPFCNRGLVENEPIVEETSLGGTHGPKFHNYGIEEYLRTLSAWFTWKKKAPWKKKREKHL